MSETAEMILLGFGFAFIGCALISAVLSKLVALRSPPEARARWTAGPAALLTALFGFAIPEGYGFDFALMVIPCGLLTYWFWRREFVSAWLDDDQPIPEGAKLANDDWKIAAAAMAAALVAALIKQLVFHSTLGR